MLLKLGVDISRLVRPMRLALSKIDDVYRNHTNQEAVCTSTYDGTHSVGSLHYAHAACDFRRPIHSTSIVVQDLKIILSPDFDVVLEETHIHVEYDPK